MSNRKSERACKISDRQAREAQREDRRARRSNSDIRPWISIGEAADLALSGIIKNMEKARAS